MPSKDSTEMYPGRPGLITPVVNIGDNFLILRQNAYHLHKVIYREGLPPSLGLIRDFGGLAIAGQSLDQSLQVQLEMNDLEVAQIRMFVLDDIRVTIKEPRSVGRYSVKNTLATISLWSHQIDQCDHLTEIFCFEDEWPFADVVNASGVALAQTRLAFYGFRYGLDTQVGAYTNLSDIKAPYMGVVAQGTFTMTQ